MLVSRALSTKCRVRVGSHAAVHVDARLVRDVRLTARTDAEQRGAMRLSRGAQKWRQDGGEEEKSSL